MPSCMEKCINKLTFIISMRLCHFNVLSRLLFFPLFQRAKSWGLARKAHPRRELRERQTKLTIRFPFSEN